MSNPNDSQAQPPRRLLFAAAFASAVMAAGGGGCNTKGSSCVVTHRTTPASCAQSVASTMQICTSDADCTGLAAWPATGRCIPFDGQMLCSYDTCLSDDDCGARPATCLCKGQWRVFSSAQPGNGCLTGNCRDDSDCPGTLCAPSGGYYGYTGYYCQTPQDQCRCDADCSSALPSCAYNPEIGAWACAWVGGAG